MLIGHALRGHGILAGYALLLLLHILLIGHLLLLFGGDVMLRHGACTHSACTGHVCLRGGNLRVVDIFRRIDVGFAVDAVFAPLWRFGGIQTCLRRSRQVSKSVDEEIVGED